MAHRHILASALAMGFIAVPVKAQTAVSIFGIIDVNVRSVRNDGSGSLHSLSTDGLQPSRFGVRGTEDLGGGLAAGFWLEGAFAADTGAARASLWSRRSTVSLISQNVGELRLGRDFTPAFRAFAQYDPMGVVGTGSILNILGVAGSGSATRVTANNAIAYYLPFGTTGFYGEAMHAFGERVRTVNTPASTDLSNNEISALRIGYAGSNWTLSTSYSETDIEVGGTGKLKQSHVGGSYKFSFAKFIAQAIQLKYQTNTQRVYQLGATVPVGISEIVLSYTHGDMSGGTAVGFRDADDANQLAASYLYPLSKRTTLYGTISVLNNRGASTLSLPTSAGAVTPGGDSKGIEFGVRHAF